jgi:hypothetical protein
MIRSLVKRCHLPLLWLIVLALLIGNLNGVVGTLVVQKVAHGLGGKKDTTAQIRTHFVRVDPARARLVGGGGNVDLSYLMPPPQNQGNSNACGSFSLSEILYALRIQRGETPSTYFSPWYHRFNTVGNSDSYTNMAQNVAAVYAPNGGMVYHWRQEYLGQPNQAEYTHADAKSAYYSVFSTGGAGTFDQIAYEVETGHPVWILSQIRDGMYYASSSNPYSSNQGALHGAHFEVVTGVYGNWLKIEGSWGANYGQGGYWYLSRYGADTTTLEAAVVSLGADVVWPRVQPLPAPRPVTPVSPPTSTPATPRPAPPAPRLALYRVLGDHALRAGPRLDAPLGRVARRGWELRGTGRAAGALVEARTLDGHSVGWIALSWVHRER